MLEYLTIPNIFLGTGLLLLLLVNLLCLVSLLQPVWGAVGGIFVYFLFIIYAGFPLVYYFQKHFGRESGPAHPANMRWWMLIFLNVLFIVQWLVWWLILRLIF